jgi:nitrate reductase beta subunit
MYRLLAIAKYEERYVIPQAHAELADRLAEQGAGAGCSLDFEGGPGNCGAVAPPAEPSFMLTEQPPRSSPPLELKVIRRPPRPDEPSAE